MIFKIDKLLQQKYLIQKITFCVFSMCTILREKEILSDSTSTQIFIIRKWYHKNKTNKYWIICKAQAVICGF